VRRAACAKAILTAIGIDNVEIIRRGYPDREAAIAVATVASAI
jgi:hypothetical protein